MTNYSGRNEDVLSLWLITDGGSQLPCHGRTWYIDPIARKNAKCNIFLPCFIDHLLIAAWIISKSSFQECWNPVSPASDMYSLCLATPDSRQCPGCGQQRLCRDQTRCHNDHWSLALRLELQTTVYTKVHNHGQLGLSPHTFKILC